jgi:hypothetical protein
VSLESPGDNIRCDWCNLRGVPYEYRGMPFSGLTACEGERLCPACRDKYVDEKINQPVGPMQVPGGDYVIPRVKDNSGSAPKRRVEWLPTTKLHPEAPRPLRRDMTPAEREAYFARLNRTMARGMAIEHAKRVDASRNNGVDDLPGLEWGFGRELAYDANGVAYRLELQDGRLAVTREDGTSVIRPGDDPTTTARRIVRDMRGDAAPRIEQPSLFDLDEEVA